MSYAEQLGQQLGGQAASGLLGGLVNRAFRKRDNKVQLEQNKKLLDQQIAAQQQMGIFNREQQMQMWNDTNTEAQLEHIKNAGLNPALMYEGAGAGGSTAASAPGSVGAESTQSVQGMGITGVSQQLLTKAQTDLIKAQTEKTKAETTKTSGIDTTIANTENELKQLDLKVNTETLWERINEIVSRSIEQQEKGLIAGQQRTIGEETIQDNINKIKQEAINTLLQSEVMKKGIELTDAQINKLSQDIIQRGQEIAIKTFQAEVEANQPGIGKIIGNLILPLTEKIKQIEGMSSPRKIKK